MSHQFGLILIATCMMLGLGCENTIEKQKKEIDVSKVGRLIVQHALKTVSIDKNTAMVWVAGTDTPVWYPINIYVRIKIGESGMTSPPKGELRMQIKSIHGKGDQRKNEETLAFTSTLAKPIRREVAFVNGNFGKIRKSPKDKNIWEVVLKDPFASDSRNANTRPFSPGNYFLSVQLKLKGQSSVFKFKKIRLKLYEK